MPLQRVSPQYSHLRPVPVRSCVMCASEMPDRPGRKRRSKSDMVDAFDAQLMGRCPASNVSYTCTPNRLRPSCPSQGFCSRSALIPAGLRNCPVPNVNECVGCIDSSKPLAPRNHRTSNGLAASINPHHPRAMRGWFPRGTGPVSSRIWFDRERHTTATQQSAPARRETIWSRALWTRWHWREVAPILHATGTASSPSPPRASPRPHHSGLRFRGPAGGSPPPRLLVLPARLSATVGCPRRRTWKQPCPYACPASFGAFTCWCASEASGAVDRPTGEASWRGSR